MKHKRYKAYSFRLNEKTYKNLIKIKKKSGKSWNLFILDLFANQDEKQSKTKFKNGEVLFTDGFTIGKNPSNIGGGFTITNAYSNVIDQEEIRKNPFTCNEAELLGVLRTFELITKNGEVYTDSKVTIAWIKSGNPKARPDLKDLCQHAKKLKDIKSIDLIYINRNENLAGIVNEQNNN